MQIFVLDTDPKLAAQYHCDKHAIKMILESCQLLCSVHYAIGTDTPPYRRTHMNHPCAVWARASEGNYLWLLNLTEHLLEEYTQRYGKIHKSTTVYGWAKANVPKFKQKEMTPFAQAVPEQYKSDNTVETYRNFYMGEKAYFAKWERNNNKPFWFKNGEEE